MKVLFYPDRSGGNPYQRELISGLEGRGVDVRIATTRGPFHLRQALKETGPADVIHLHWPEALTSSPGRVKTWMRSGVALAEVAYLKRRGVKLVWTIHNLHSHRQRFASTELWVLRRLARMADALIVHFPEGAVLVRERYGLSDGKQIAMVPHGNFLGCYENRVTREDARRRLGLHADDKVFLFFGWIRPYKGLLNLLHAFTHVQAPDVKLVLAGDDSHPESRGMRGVLREVMSRDQRVRTYFGFVPDPDIQVYMNASDAVVLPYDDIFTSGSALLAMSFGKAIVAPDLPHLRYLLEDAGGVLYPRLERRGLEHALQAALEVDLSAMGARNFDSVRAFSWERIAEETEGVYVKAMGRRKREDRAPVSTHT